MSDPLLTRIDTVFLPVRDLARAVEWYRANLGWPIAWQNDAVAVFRADGTPLTLLQHRYPGLSDAPEGETFAPVTQVPFNFYAPDIAAAHGRLRERGVDVGEIVDHGGLQEFLVRDADGNALSVVHF